MFYTPCCMPFFLCATRFSSVRLISFFLFFPRPSKIRRSDFRRPSKFRRPDFVRPSKFRRPDFRRPSKIRRCCLKSDFVQLFFPNSVSFSIPDFLLAKSIFGNIILKKPKKNFAFHSAKFSLFISVSADFFWNGIQRLRL